MKAALVVPVYQHGEPLADVLAELEPFGLTCFVIDDGSDESTRERLLSLARKHSFVELHRHRRNEGKGVALRTGFRLAAYRGFTHVIHLDADGQHHAPDVRRFLAELERNPDALVVGQPRFDDSIPWNRLYGRQLSRALVWLATLSRAVDDPLIGFRGVPLEPTLALLDRVEMGDRMDFEPELAVRLVWERVPIVNLPTPVTYPRGGHSNFRAIRDDVALAWLYLRLGLGMLKHAPSLLWRRPVRRAAERS